MEGNDKIHVYDDDYDLKGTNDGNSSEIDMIVHVQGPREHLIDGDLVRNLMAIGYQKVHLYLDQNECESHTPFTPQTTLADEDLELVPFLVYHIDPDADEPHSPTLSPVPIPVSVPNLDYSDLEICERYSSYSEGSFSGSSLSLYSSSNQTLNIDQLFLDGDDAEEGHSEEEPQVEDDDDLDSNVEVDELNITVYEEDETEEDGTEEDGTIGSPSRSYTVTSSPTQFYSPVSSSSHVSSSSPSEPSNHRNQSSYSSDGEENIPTEEDSKKSSLCPICLEHLFSTAKPLGSTPCGHVFCRPCFRRSYTTLKQCPTCRKSVSLEQFRPIYF